jgi:hypothetical protein
MASGLNKNKLLDHKKNHDKKYPWISAIKNKVDSELAACENLIENVRKE